MAPGMYPVLRDRNGMFLVLYSGTNHMGGPPTVRNWCISIYIGIAVYHMAFGEELDKNKSGSVEFNEFLYLMTKRERGTTSSEVAEAFRAYDREQKGAFGSAKSLKSAGRCVE